MFVKRFSRALVVVTAASLVMAAAAFADTAVVDGDLGVADNQGLMALGSVCPSSTALAAESANWYAKRTGSTKWANGAELSFLPHSANPIEITTKPVGGDGSLTAVRPSNMFLPGNWTSLANDTLSAAAAGSVTVTPGTVEGAYSAQVKVQLSGAQDGGGTKTANADLTVTWTVLSATDPSCSVTPPCDNYFTASFLKPFDGSTPSNLINNQIKNGRVAPVKVEIFEYDCNDVLIGEVESGTVTLKIGAVAAQNAGTADPLESYADAGASSGNTNQFRWTDPLGQGFWIFNLDTKALGLNIGQSYKINVFLNGIEITNTYGQFTPTK